MSFTLSVNHKFIDWRMCISQLENFLNDYRVLANEMDGVLGHDSALIRLHWAGDNLGY